MIAEIKQMNVKSVLRMVINCLLIFFRKPSGVWHLRLLETGCPSGALFVVVRLVRNGLPLWGIFYGFAFG
jgi:hypothetical protein